jgi:single-stranded-DNA-specific exonuclease
VERASAEDVKRLSRELLLQPATASVLANRGYVDPAAAQNFLAPRFAQLPDPAQMKNMDAALGVLVPAIREKRRIVIHGDYDVDGVSGSVILTEFLRAAGADVEPFIPDRKTHGYGFTRASLADCLALGAKIIVTCDCGTASVTEIEEAKAAGVQVVVTDHHEPGPVLPAAAALLNPRQAGETFPDRNLCGTRPRVRSRTSAPCSTWWPSPPSATWSRSRGSTASSPAKDWPSSTQRSVPAWRRW